ncbi:hypothetical protein BST27_19075 [Mycobacterium intermedium]|uniref:Uncharacterized protein n=1 Tax=Mycobacterium intermedium TaxID=28445 RepID=A0A1E3SD74_MYCIE|nr:hypothetical protein BHQ20_14405 [Mycobacterium intermedium]OPE48014.1 hypothetical protein BV508_19690 [Mycobacterium intermedium]ORA99908.1 hypothetical protein BST27_19075 [Mycobacterium intermedium]
MGDSIKMPPPLSRLPRVTAMRLRRLINRLSPMSNARRAMCRQSTRIHVNMSAPQRNRDQECEQGDNGR